MSDNYPPGVTSAHPHFWTPDAPDYDHDTAVDWIKAHELVRFSEYVEERYPEIVALFREQLHPENVLEWGDEIVGANPVLFDIFLWQILDEERFSILVDSFTNANWEKYEEYVS